MPLTLSRASNREGVMGDMRYAFVDITFDSSYPTGGESLLPADLGWDSIHFVKPQNIPGYMFDYEETGQTLRAFRASPLLIVEEALTIASDVGTLRNIPAFVSGVDVTAGGTTSGFRVIPSTDTPITRQVAVNFTTGVVTFAAADAVTAARFTYFPVSVGSIFASPTVNEAVVAAGAGVNLAARAAMVQYVYDTTGNTLLVVVPVGEAPNAGEVAIDINNSGNTTITTNAGINGNSLLVTYIPFTALPDPSMFVDDGDISSTFEPYNFTTTSNYYGMTVSAYGGFLVGEEGDATNRVVPIGGPLSTGANNTMVQWQPALNIYTAAQNTNLATVSNPWIVIPPAYLTNVMREVPNATDLSTIVTRVLIYGR
jgi:hypothetical protein